MKLRILSKVCLFCASIFGLIFLSTLKSYPVEKKEQKVPAMKIVCFGDSITAGRGVTKDEAFPSLLSKMSGLPVINAGRCGDTTQDGLGRLKKDVLASHPNMVIVEFGGNDYLDNLSLRQAVDNLRVIIKKIQEQGARVVLADISCGWIMKDYREYYSRLARETNVLFIPNLMGGIFNNAFLKHDLIHPNRIGHKIIAARIFEALRPYLS